jgi:hypothetical protein
MLGANMLVFAVTTSPGDQNIKDVSAVQALLYDVGLPDLKIPSDATERSGLHKVVISILQLQGASLAAKGVRLGFFLGMLSDHLVANIPSALSEIKSLAADVGISGDKIDRLLERRNSTQQADQAEILVEEIEAWTRDMRNQEDPRIFISHSSADREVASGLVNLLRSALRMEAAQIRCTSVDGYGLPIGVNIEEILRGDVEDVEVFIGLISKRRLASLYVLFELGARWGSGKPILPILLSGMSASELSGPLANIHAVTLCNAENVNQLIDQIGKTLGISSDKTGLHREIMKLVNKLRD